MEFRAGHVERVHTSYNDYHPTKRDQTEPQRVEFTPKGNRGIRKTVFSAHPLFRGVQDSITRGDLILYCSIEGRYYYLGPINTKNKPSESPDNTYDPGTVSNIFSVFNKDIKNGYNKNIPKKKVKKLSKPRHTSMDFPIEYLENAVNPALVEYAESNFSDLMLEGRYGNAIRIGARHQNPKIIISNNNLGNVETLSDGGSIFAMTSLGTIGDNFPVDGNNYRLSIDTDTITEFSNDVQEEKTFNYQYGEVKLPTDNEQREFDQIIISSDKITFNTLVNDVVVSSNRNINIGANKNIAISNKGFSVIDSKNIYIGKQSKGRTEPMVLGDKLRQLLVRILRLIADSYSVGAPPGTPVPLSVFESLTAPGTLKSEVNKIITDFNLLEGGELIPGVNPVPLSNTRENLNIVDGVPTTDRADRLASFLSQHHFIEPNRS
tara:strand:- start:48 stop:1349 length:1302 start_codon:yes stop_codon:yes gene_type:complete